MIPRTLLLGAALFAAACGSDSTDPGSEPGTAPPVPSNLVTTSLDGAVALLWSDNAYQNNPANFRNYAVYSSPYDLDGGDCVGATTLEGTTVAPEFVAGALTNGAPRCFYVTAVSVTARESGNSAVVHDTPRPDARNVLIYARQFQDAGSGFRFWLDNNANGNVERSELGLVTSSTLALADFTVERDGTGNLFLTPSAVEVTVALYGTTPVEDLTSINVAPGTGFDGSAIQAVPGWGYVFQIDEGDGFFRYGAVRTTHVGRDFLILDWAYQTDPGNPELRRAPKP